MPAVPARLNEGPWAVDYTAPVLRERVERQTMVLPICSLGTPEDELAKLGGLVLPPLYHEALVPELRDAIVARIRQCLPYYEGSRRRQRSRGSLEVVDLPRRSPERPSAPAVVALSVDTAVEEHGPHLPLATDRIQSYAVLQAACMQVEGVYLAPPVDYGHLVWGLGYGLSVDIPPALLTPYVTRYIDAALDWSGASAAYVVDVHGSPAHREAVQQAVAASKAKRKAFRWLHEPLAEWTWSQGDAHAGAVETAMIEHINADLVDRAWWPGRASELQANQISLAAVVELSRDVPRLVDHADATGWNGIVGRIENYPNVSGATMMALAVETAVSDLRQLIRK